MNKERVKELTMKKETIFREFSNLPTLKTSRLTLRKMLVSDTDDMFEYAKLANVTKYLLWYPHRNRTYTKEYLEYIGGRYSAGMFYDWALVFEPNGKMIGTCGFTSFNCSSDSAEVGYVINPAYWGKGIATEALERVVRFGFEVLKLHRIEAKFIEGNDASRRVMEHVGMRFEGFRRDEMLIKEKYVNIGVCAILESDWKALHRN